MRRNTKTIKQIPQKTKNFKKTQNTQKYKQQLKITTTYKKHITLEETHTDMRRKEKAVAPDKPWTFLLLPKHFDLFIGIPKR